MTHSDIYEKFMIEYDKDNVTSSYPSLTRKEQATILDKAYLALIAQKITGNNVRRSGLETDIKSISDLQPLITSSSINLTSSDAPSNEKYGALPTDPKFLYFVSAHVSGSNSSQVVTLVNHDVAKKFFVTSYNKPWIKTPICYIQGGNIHVVYDPTDQSDVNTMKLTFIKQPAKFVSSQDTATFELNDSMAEELITLAITFALENIESQRLNSKLNMRGLEA